MTTRKRISDRVTCKKTLANGRIAHEPCSPWWAWKESESVEYIVVHRGKVKIQNQSPNPPIKYSDRSLKVIKKRVDYTEKGIKEYSSARTDISRYRRKVTDSSAEHGNCRRIRCLDQVQNSSESGVAEFDYSLTPSRMSKFLSDPTCHLDFSNWFCTLLIDRQALQVGYVPRIFLQVFPTPALEIVENEIRGKHLFWGCANSSITNYV